VRRYRLRMKECVLLLAIIGCCLGSNYIVQTVYDTGDCTGNQVVISAVISGSCTLGYLSQCSGNNVTTLQCTSTDCSSGCSTITSFSTGCSCPGCFTEVTCSSGYPSIPGGWVVQDAFNTNYCSGDPFAIDALPGTYCFNGTMWSCTSSTVSINMNCSDNSCSKNCVLDSVPTGCSAIGGSSSSFQCSSALPLLPSLGFAYFMALLLRVVW